MISCRIVKSTHHIMNMPKKTHWGLSISMGIASSSSSSGKTGASFSTVVNKFTVETVTRSRKAVSTREHLFTGLQYRMEVPRGIRIAALAQSTIAWWNRSPWLHLRGKWVLFWLTITADTYLWVHETTKSFNVFETIGQHMSNVSAFRSNFTETIPSLRFRRQKYRASSRRHLLLVCETFQ